MIFVSPGGGVEHCVVRDNRNIRMIWLFYSTLLFVTSNIAITDVTDVITTGSDIFIFFFFFMGCGFNFDSFDVKFFSRNVV